MNTSAFGSTLDLGRTKSIAGNQFINYSQGHSGNVSFVFSKKGNVVQVEFIFTEIPCKKTTWLTSSQH